MNLHETCYRANLIYSPSSSRIGLMTSSCEFRTMDGWSVVAGDRDWRQTPQQNSPEEILERNWKVDKESTFGWR